MALVRSQRRAEAINASFFAMISAASVMQLFKTDFSSIFALRQITAAALAEWRWAAIGVGFC
ncbi:MAG: hypothetical protein HOK89_09715 [Rhodospirillaceae bacterium]|nr:hypothetical protein [Rhodospirillaceae bacterium]